MVFKIRSCRWWRGRGLVDVLGLSYLDSSVRIALPGVFQQSSVAVLAGVVVGGVGLDPHRRRAIGGVLGFVLLSWVTTQEICRRCWVWGEKARLSGASSLLAQWCGVPSAPFLVLYMVLNSA